MAAETIIAISAAVSAATAIGSSTYQGLQGAEAASEAKKASAIQSSKQDELLKQNKDQDFLSSQTTVRDKQKAALQAKNAQEAQAKGGTILTSPLGVLQNSYGGGRSVLGG